MEEVKASGHMLAVEIKKVEPEEVKEPAVTQGGILIGFGWDKFLRLLAAVFGLAGALFASYGTLVESPKQIAERSQTYWDSNQPQIDTFAHEKANRTVGFLFIAASFVLSASSVFAPPKRVRIRWIVIGTVFSCLLIILGLYFQKAIYSSAKGAVELAITKD